MDLDPINTILGIMKNSPSPGDSRWQQKITEDPLIETEEKTSHEYIMSNNPEAKKYNPPASVTCIYCGATRYTKGFMLGDRVFWAPYGPERCICPQAIAEHEKAKAERIAQEEKECKAEADRKMKEKVHRIIGQSGMGERFLRRTFSTFEITEHNRQAAIAAQRYADNFHMLLPKPEKQEPGRNGLFISGPKGTGKTHLAASIANQLIRKGTPVICMTMIDLLERIRRTYAQRGDNEGTILNIYKTVPLLIIDDMGKEPPTEWTVSTIYNIINGRYEAYMPTVITTNYDDQTLITRMTPQATKDIITAEATIDRLMEMCKGIILAGPSWRQR